MWVPPTPTKDLPSLDPAFWISIFHVNVRDTQQDKLMLNQGETGMNTVKLAIPSNNPGGLEAGMGMHFGHCDIYTIVEIEEDKVRSVSTLENEPHAQGGCLAPVQRLAVSGVKALLAGGMGMRPLMGFQQAGITVHYAGDFPTVGQAVDAYLQHQLPPFSTDFTCRGGDHCSS